MGLIRIVIASFLVHHGLVHAAVWLPLALTNTPPVDASWSLPSGLHLDDVRRYFVVLTVTVALLYAGAGVGMVFHLAWWRLATFVGSLVSLVLIALSLHTWWLAPAVLIDVVLLSAVVHSYLGRTFAHPAQRRGTDMRSSRMHGLGTVRAISSPERPRS